MLAKLSVLVLPGFGINKERDTCVIWRDFNVTKKYGVSSSWLNLQRTLKALGGIGGVDEFPSCMPVFKSSKLDHY